MIKDIASSAAALWDGGWKSTDREQLIEEYFLAPDEADELCKELERFEQAND